MISLEEIKERLGVPVEETVISKDGVDHKCILIGTGDVRPIVYDDMLAKVTEDNVDAFIKSVKNSINKGTSMYNDVNSLIDNFDIAKPLLKVCVRMKTEDDAIKRDFLDIEQYIRIIHNDFSLIIKTPLLDRWSVTEDELFEIAISNSKHDYNISSVSDKLRSIGIGLEIPEDNILYVINSNTFMYDAGCLCNTDILDEATEVADADEIFIIPSSVHEILFFKAGVFESNSELIDLIKLINRTEVPNTDVLSDSLYKYNRITKELEVVHD